MGGFGGVLSVQIFSYRPWKQKTHRFYSEPPAVKRAAMQAEVPQTLDSPSFVMIHMLFFITGKQTTLSVLRGGLIRLTLAFTCSLQLLSNKYQHFTGLLRSTSLRWGRHSICLVLP